MNDGHISDFLRTFTDPELASLRDKLRAKLLTNTRYVSLSIAGKSVAQDELVPSSLLMGLVAGELRRRGLITDPSPSRRTVARFA